MKLYKHQQELVDKNPDKWLLAHGVGTGKTITTLTLAKNKGGNWLIICPKSIVEQWKEQTKYCVYSKEQFKKYLPVLTRYDGIIIDEIHYFSNYRSALTKSLLSYIQQYNPKYIYGLTGTPYMSSSWNIYTYGLIFGRPWKWFKWKQTFFTDIRMGNRKIPVEKKQINGVRTEKILADLVNKLGNTVKLEDCFDVPEQIFETEYFELTNDQKQAIEMLDDMESIVRFTKIHQICGGSLKGNEYEDDRYFKSEKLDRLLDLLQEHKKIAVVCRYNNEINYIRSQITKRKVFVINGASKNKNDITKHVSECDDCIVIINAACSEGYSLSSIPVMVFYSYDFSLKNMIQMRGRIQRADNIKKNVYISLIVKKTIDEEIYKTVVINKQDFHVEIMK